MSPKAALSVDRFAVDDLVLPVSGSVDPAMFDPSSYEDFIDAVVAGREYSRQAIRTALQFLASGRYDNIKELADEAFASAPALERRYGTLGKLLEKLPFPDKLACSLDLATGTGKSYVMFCLARIMLNEGLVSRVLILCPSRTIEAGLMEKFDALLADSDLTALLPDTKGTRLPERVDATGTVKEGQICIENIHAVYEATGSSIADSFEGQGRRTLVISDEAHHIYSPSDAKLKKWREFIASPAYDFRYHVGLSGTCYVGDEYFADVIFRYSIRDAINDRWVKDVFYVAKDESNTDDARFQKLLAQHEANRKTYRPLKPLTIAVTKSIKAAEELGEDLVDFLARQLNGDRDTAESRVLVVSSSSRHEANLGRLTTVDDASNPAEWIISVSMLSEGWDVKNVFQIYPHEKRAFNSKLLVAQVLGRGLRRPEGIKAEPRVYVFNHQRWAPEVEELVAEVLDQETTVAQRPSDGRPIRHFDLHRLAYKEVPTGIEARAVEKPREIKNLNLRPQRDAPESTEFVSVSDSEQRVVLTTLVRETYYPTAEVVADVRRRMLLHDQTTNGDLADAYPKKRVERLIVSALKRLKLSGEEVSQENRQLIMSAFGSLRQKTLRAGAEWSQEPDGVVRTSTSAMGPVRVRISGLTSHVGIFYDELSPKLGTLDDAAALKKARAIEVPTFLRRVDNSFLFKSPVNVVATSHLPELLFVERLLDSENAAALKAWIKAPDVGFFSLEYGYQPGGDGRSKRGQFNPDFFLRREGADEVIAVETKADDDTSDINVGKLAFAEAYFLKLNELLREDRKKRRYQFHFLSPRDYDDFFAPLREGALEDFVSTLQAALSV
ncbi:MAG: DEAD/DEAH box helicase family protein [Actinobacteria bacterium]|nr:DEAD/DEAH box helicase family protein [Actinomycetota bacterium]